MCDQGLTIVCVYVYVCVLTSTVLLNFALDNISSAELQGEEFVGGGTL